VLAGALIDATCVLALSLPVDSTPGGFPAAYAELCSAGLWAKLTSINGLQFECVDEAPQCDNRIFYCSTAGLSQCNCGANETIGTCSPQVCPVENSNFLACLARLPLGEYQDLQAYYDLNSAAYQLCGDELLASYCCIYQAQLAGQTPQPNKYFENPLCVVPTPTTGAITSAALTTQAITSSALPANTYLIIFVFGVPFSGFDQAKVFNGICTYFKISPCDFAQFQNIEAGAVSVAKRQRQTAATRNSFTITPSDLTTQLLDLIASDQLAGLSAAIGYPILSASATSASSTASITPTSTTGGAASLSVSVVSVLVSALLALLL